MTNTPTYRRVTLRDGKPFKGVLEAQAVAIDYSFAVARQLSRKYGEFGELTERHVALQAPACPLQIDGQVHVGLTVGEAIEAIRDNESPPADVSAIEPHSHAVLLDDMRKAAQKVQGCAGLARLANVTASLNTAPSHPIYRPRHVAKDGDITPTAAFRFALVAKLQTAAIATASAPRAVRSL